MNQLQVINQDGRLLVDSRQVAVMITKEHGHLLRDIKGYAKVLGKSNFGLADFFIEDSYLDAQEKMRPMFLITKKGCDMVANKMTGEKGILFTATYVTEFEEMEKRLNTPRDSVRLIHQATQNLLASQELIVDRLDEIEVKVDNQITLDSGQQRRLQQAINKKVCVTELDKSARGELFRQIHKEIKDRWQVPSYKDVLRQDLQGVLDYISAWVPIRRAG